MCSGLTRGVENTQAGECSINARVRIVETWQAEETMQREVNERRNPSIFLSWAIRRTESASPQHRTKFGNRIHRESEADPVSFCP
jgi:hypothetical protein